MGNQEPSESGAGLSEQVAEALRERIISGQLPGGSKLNERELSAELQVSRIPLREALPLLEAEGFIHSEARRGSFVHTFTLRDAVEVFDLRLRLEPFAAQCAALRVAGGASPEDLLASLEYARTGVPGEQASGRNSDLHEEIVRLADHDLLRRLSSLLNGRVRWLFRLTPERDTPGMWEEHAELVHAIAEGRPALAEALASAHVERGRHASLPHLSDRLPSEPVPRRGRKTRSPA
jgi:DNA-binding GntR family transcriptional regulator